MASHPPKPNGVGVAMPSMVILRSLRGMLIFKTFVLKSPCLPRVFNTASYSAGMLCADASEADKIRKPRILVYFICLDTPEFIQLDSLVQPWPDTLRRGRRKR